MMLQKFSIVNKTKRVHIEREKKKLTINVHLKCTTCFSQFHCKSDASCLRHGIIKIFRKQRNHSLLQSEANMRRRFKRISLCMGCHPRILEFYHSNNTDISGADGLLDMFIANACLLKKFQVFVMCSLIKLNLFN